MNIKKIEKIKRKIEEELDKDSFMKFAKQRNVEMYKSEFNKLFNREMKYLRQDKIGKTESKKHIDFLQAETEFNHIHNPWLRKHLARNKLKKQKKL